MSDSSTDVTASENTSDNSSNNNSDTEVCTHGRKILERKEVSTQCGKWLRLKNAVETDETLRAKVESKAKCVIKLIGYPLPSSITPADDRKILEKRETLPISNLVDTALYGQPADTVKWDV